MAISEKDVKTVDIAVVPSAPNAGAYTFLKELAKKLQGDQVLQVTASDDKEAKKVQSRWRSYFKGTAKSRRVVDNGKNVIYLWLKK